jgi:hypothetical protein
MGKDGLLSLLVPARRIAEHGGGLIWRVALLHQPQDVPMGSLHWIARLSVAFMQLCCG